jgi:anti-sigma B factor antagonist
MNIEKTNNNGTVTLAVTGELTALTAEQLNAVIEQALAETSKLALDFKGLEYLASAGLRVILNTKKKLSASGGEFVIRNVTDDVMKVFEITGLDDILAFE